MNAAATPSTMGKLSQSIGDWLQSFFYIVKDGKVGDPRFDGLTLAMVCGVTVLALFSACWAASIAASRRRHAFLHFFPGLLLPVLYPLFILLALDVPGKWTLSQQSRKPEAQPKPAEAAPEEELPVDADGNLEFQPTQPYFARISRKSDGRPAGPWRATFNGATVTVTQIIEVLPECVNVEFYDASPEKKRTMRIPYGKLEGWEAIS